MQIKQSILNNFLKEISLYFNTKNGITLNYKETEKDQYTFFLFNKSKNLSEEIFYISILKRIPLGQDYKVILGLEFRFHNQKLEKFEDTNKLNSRIREYLDSKLFEEILNEFSSAEYLFKIFERNHTSYLSFYENPSRICEKVTWRNTVTKELVELIINTLEHNKLTAALVIFQDLLFNLNNSNEFHNKVLFDLAIKLDKIIKSE